jgi:hypothetical protein
MARCFAETLASMLVLAEYLAGCSDGCGNQVVQSAAAPGRDRRAVVFERDCGATTNFTTQISVVRGEPVPGRGNVFIADAGIIPTSWGGPWARVSWRAPDRLLVQYDGSARVFVRNAKAAGVTIEFEAVAKQR